MWQLSDKERQIMAKVIAPDSHIYQQKTDLPGSPTIQEVLSRELISYREIDAIYKLMPPTAELYRFLEVLRPVFASSSDEPKDGESKAYRERIEQLKNEQANREYRAMTRSVDQCRSTKKIPSFAQEIKQMDRQIIVIANTLLTVLGSFAFGFFGIALAYPDAGYDAPTRMLVGLVLGTVVFFADLYFIIKGMEM